MNWLSLVTGIANVALMSNPRTAPLAPFVSNGISLAQAAHDARKQNGVGLSGAERLEFARTEIINGILGFNSAAPPSHHIDPALVNDAFMHTVSDIVDATKIVGQAKAGTAPHVGSTPDSTPEGLILPPHAATDSHSSGETSGEGQMSTGEPEPAAEPAQDASQAAQTEPAGDMPEPAIGH